jgi:hypothetical protein
VNPSAIAKIGNCGRLKIEAEAQCRRFLAILAVLAIKRNVEG